MQYLFESETVTGSTIDALRAALPTDQAREIAPGQTVSVIRGDFPRGSHDAGSTITIWHDTARVAIATNGDSDWGTYYGSYQLYNGNWVDEVIVLDTTDSDGGNIVLGLDGGVLEAEAERFVYDEQRVEA